MTWNLRDKFNEVSLQYADKTAIQYKKDNKWISVSYGELSDGVRSLTGFLLKEGIKKNDKVAVLLENGPEWPLIFFSTISAGAVSIPINPESVPEEIENILKDSECELVFAAEGSFAMMEEIRRECPSIKKIVSVESDVFRDAAGGSPGQVADVGLGDDDLACILYTSGTTAEPKGVMLSHGNLLANCDSLSRLNVIGPGEGIVSVLPLHHAYPLTGTMLFPLLNGCRIVYPESLRTEDILEAMRETRASVFVAVPQILYLFHQKITETVKKVPFPINIPLNLTVEFLRGLRQKTGVNLARYLFYGIHRKFGRSMRLFISGGARLDEEVQRTLFKFGFTILEGYGLTETSPFLTVNLPERTKVGSVGVPIPDVELKIKDKDENGAGEVLARGPNIMKGYYRREDLTAKVIKDGWFHTGDLGYIDAGGYLFLTGRIKEVIVLSSGVNIYPEEIEEAYTGRAPVKEMCVFEVPAGKGADENLVLWAAVVPDLEFFKKYGEINLSNVIKERFDNVSRGLPAYKRIMGFSITLEEFPRTLLGKVKRYEVKEKYASKLVKEEEKVSAPAELSKEDMEIAGSESAAKIIRYLKKQTGLKRDIGLNDLLELDLGIDSLGRIELASGLEKVFDMRIENEVIGNAFTVRDLVTGVGSLREEGTKALSSFEKEITSGPGYWKKLFQVLPREETLKKIDLKPGFGAWLAGFLFTCMLYAVFRIFYSLKAEGKDNLPKEGPYILYGNHTSYFDGLLVAASLPDFPRLDLFFVGFRPYFNVPVIRNLIKVGRIIPLDFTSHLLEALRSCYYVLTNGKDLCLFPEGLRTLDGDIGEFKKGFGILAKESKAKLVPVVLEGAFEAWPRTSKFPKCHPIKVRFGEVLDLENIEEEGFALGAKDGYEAICVGAREALIKLKEKK